MEAKRAAKLIMSGQFDASNISELYDALKGNEIEFADALAKLARFAAKYAEDIAKKEKRKYNFEDFKTLHGVLNGYENEKGEKVYGKLYNTMLRDVQAEFARPAEGGSITVDHATRSKRAKVVVDEAKDNSSAEKQLNGISPAILSLTKEIKQDIVAGKIADLPEVVPTKNAVVVRKKDGNETRFTDANHALVKPATRKPQINDFELIVKRAQLHKQKITLGETMTPEFRSALIEACAKGNVQITNMLPEDFALYMSFVGTKEKKVRSVERKPEVRVATVTKPEKEGKQPKPAAQPKKPAVEEKVVKPVSTQDKNPAEQDDAAKAEETRQALEAKREEYLRKAAEDARIAREKAEVAARAADEADEAAKRAKAAVAALGIADTGHADAAPAGRGPSDDGNKGPAAPAGKGPSDDGNKGPADNGDKGPVAPVNNGDNADKPAGQKIVDERETVTKEKKEKNKKEKKWKKVLLAVAIGAATVLGGGLIMRNCSGNDKKGDNRDNDKDKIENIAMTPSDSIRTEANDSTITWQEAQDSIVRRMDNFPTKWEPWMTVSPEQFDNMYNIVKAHDDADGKTWKAICINSDNVASSYGLEPDMYIYKVLRLVAWTSPLDGNFCDPHHAAQAKITGLRGTTGSLYREMVCGDYVDEVQHKKNQVALDAISDGSEEIRGRLNVFTLEEICPGISKHNDHDANGWIIGKSHYRLTEIRGCGDKSRAGFEGERIVEPEKEPEPEPVIEPVRKSVPPIIQQPDPEPEKDPEPEPEEVRDISITANGGSLNGDSTSDQSAQMVDSTIKGDTLDSSKRVDRSVNKMFHEIQNSDRFQELSPEAQQAIRDRYQNSK